MNRHLMLAGLLMALLSPLHAQPTALDIEATDFDCLSEMTPVRGFFIDNLNGDLEATQAAAEAPKGATYPAGSVVQLVPTEVMVKHPKGVSPATNDWEFFELKVSDAGSEIVTRGFEDVKNRFGGNCLECHAKAEPQWDMICETGHGCDPIPLTGAMIKVVQKVDPRCEQTQPLSEAERQLLDHLKPFLQ
ncbi:hypothetical protein FHR99_002509 [Litorivivens lipolytica]|uniref:Cytochrome c domain-containing protein n=2 Tax=Litorivivens lipolytica TaxID=1524264 RepID=A0A7W4W6B1_9GAMM|nr:hypothetical protein [Litorivivens lipolytica]